MSLSIVGIGETLRNQTLLATWLSGIPGNSKADELAKQETSVLIIPVEEIVDMVLSTCNLLIKERAIEKLSYTDNGVVPPLEKAKNFG